MGIKKYIDGESIFNTIIGVFVSYLLVILAGLMKHLVKFLLTKLYPVKFIVGFVEFRSSVKSIYYANHKIVDLGDIHQSSLPSLGIDLFVKPEVRFAWLYEKAIVRVYLEDSNDVLGISILDKLPGGQCSYKVSRFSFENNIVKHIHLDLKPSITFKNYKIPINIYFQGNLYMDDIFLTVSANTK